MREERIEKEEERRERREERKKIDAGKETREGCHEKREKRD